MDSSQRPTSTTPSHPQAFPSPGITAARPHSHISPRLFIGPLPKSTLHSAEAEDNRTWYHSLAKQARKLAREEEEWGMQGQLIRDGDGGRRDWLKGKIVEGHERRRAKRLGVGSDDDDECEEGDTDPAISTPPNQDAQPNTNETSWFSSLSSDPSTSTSSKKWVGSSFLIGGPLHDSPRAQQSKSMDTTTFQRMNEDGSTHVDQSTTDAVDQPGEQEQRSDDGLKPPRRPSLMESTSSVAQSFQTARTHLSSVINPNLSTTSVDEAAKDVYPETTILWNNSPQSLEGEPTPAIPTDDFSLSKPGAPGNGINQSLRSTPTLRPREIEVPANSASEDEGSSTRNLIRDDVPHLTGTERPGLSHMAITTPGKLETRSTGTAVGGETIKGKDNIQQKLRSALKSGKSKVEHHPDRSHDVVSSMTRRPKTVQFPPTDESVISSFPARASSSSRADDRSVHDPPLNPKKVLARSGDEVEGTSAGVVEAAASQREEEGEQDDITPGQVVMRDRMLVRVSHSRDSGMVAYDEEIERRKPCSWIDGFEEYLVVYRKGRVELYQDWKTPFKERYYHTKRLCYNIPLALNFTSISIYSHDDLSFCLCLDSERYALERETGFWGHMQQERLKKGAQGTEIFTILCRQRDRAVDWCWEIWKELGGELPATLDVQVPAMSAVIRLPIPPGDSVGDEGGRRSLTRAKVMEACVGALSDIPGYHDLLQQTEEQTGQKAELSLAWQTGGRLDWITKSQDYDTDHKKRSWSVLSGYSVMPLREISQLELLPTHHKPSAVRLSDKRLLEEPLNVEGFLTKIGEKSAPNVDIYLHSYSGNLFASDVKGVHTPLPLPSEKLPSGKALDLIIEAFSAAEYKRGAKNILSCTGYIDFRDIDDVTEVEGGKETKAHRRFRITLRTGEKLLMQTHSESSRKEWIRSINDHREYWRAKQRVDARQKMEATGTLTHAPHPDANLKHEIDGGHLQHLWHWCCLEACTPIIHAGRLFVKKSSTAQFRASYCILTRGHLVRFRIRRATAYHHKQKNHSLQQAYVYAGLLAQNEVTSKTREDAWNGEPRVYQDGLECADGAEDCTFAIWITGPDSEAKKRNAGTEDEQRYFVPPPLSKKPKKLLIFRARSRIERDVWLWSIQVEMQRMAYSDPDRVRNERNAGLVPERR